VFGEVGDEVGVWARLVMGFPPADGGAPWPSSELRVHPVELVLRIS
jgi:hypothetical protein